MIARFLGERIEMIADHLCSHVQFNHISKKLPWLVASQMDMVLIVKYTIHEVG